MKKQTGLIFTGDIGFDKYMEGKWADSELISQEVMNFLHRGDHVIINVEGPIVSDKGKAEIVGTGPLTHSMNERATKVFDKMKADIWNLCNNHIMDMGAKGIEESLKQAKLHKALTIGAGMNIDEASKPIILNEAGGIGLISVGYRRGCKPADEDMAGCFMWHDLDRIEKRISEIKTKCRWCVMMVHGGEEFTSLPSPYTRERYIKYLEMGADMVISHHPHVPMNYETIGDKIIFYSLGNFIFDTDYQRAQFNTDIGIVVKINFTEDKYTWEALGIKIDREKEQVIKGDLPEIFVDVEEKEYNLLAPLAAKMLVSAYKRQAKFLNPKEYANASEEKWRENFTNPKRSGRVEGEGLDFLILCPLAEKAADRDWERSSLEGVKRYILEQI